MGLFDKLKQMLLGDAPPGSQEHQIADVIGGMAAPALIAAGASTITAEVGAAAKEVVAGGSIPPLAAADMIVNMGGPGGGKGHYLS